MENTNVLIMRKEPTKSAMYLYILCICLCVSPYEATQPYPSNKVVHDKTMERHWRHNHGDVNSSLNMVCYLGMVDKYSGELPPSLNVTLCTHIILLGTNINNSEMIPQEASHVDFYFKRVRLMKKLKPSLKVLVSNGGKFSPVMQSAANRKKFAESIIPFLTTYGFDGVDLDWEFPAWGDHILQREQRHNFSLVLHKIRETFDNHTSTKKISKYLLTVAVAATYPLIIACYEIPEIARYVDFINLMSYDIHSFIDVLPFTGYNAPLYSGSSELDKTVFKEFNMVAAAEIYVNKGMKRSQIMVGIPTYGHTFELLDENCHSVYCLAIGVNKTLSADVGYDVMCDLLKGSYKEQWDNETMVPYAFYGKTWISYDNEKSVSMKAKWVRDNNYGGVMTFQLRSDDYIGKSCGTKWPLHLAINKVLYGES